MISKKFLQSSILYTFAGALPLGSGVVLAFFSLYFLPVDKFGALSVYTTFSALVQVLIIYSFDSTVFIYFHEYKNDQSKLSIFISSAFLFMIATSVGVSLISMGIGWLLFDNLFEGKDITFYPFGFLSVATAAFQAFFKVYSTLLQSREKPVLFFWSNLISFALISIFTVAGLVVFPQTLIGPVGGRTLAAILCGAWVLFQIFKEFGFQFDYKLLRSSFAYNNAAFIYQIQQWVINYFDKLLMVLYLTLTAVGKYDFALKCMMGIDFLMGGLYNSFYSKVIGIVVTQEKKESTLIINRYYNGFIGIMMVMVCICILALPLLFGSGILPDRYSGYQESLQFIPFLGLIYLARGVRYYFNFPYGALKYPQPLPIIYLIVSVVKVGLMVYFIPQYGVFAVLGSALVSVLVEIILLRFVIRKKFIFHFNVLKLVGAPVTLGVFIAVMELSGFSSNLVHLFYLILCLGMLWWLYRNEIPMIRPFGLLK